MRAAHHEKQGDLDKAIDDYTEAIRLELDNANAYQARAQVYAQLKQWDKAIEDFGQVIELDPEDGGAWYRRANACYEKRDLDKAIADCTEAIRLDPTNHWAYDRRGQAYFAKGELDQAIADHSEAIRLQPERPLYYRHRVPAFVAKGDLDRAINDLEQAAEVGYQPCHFQPLLLLVTAGDTEGYRRACARLYEQFGQSNDPKTAFWLAWVCRFGPQAIDDLDRALGFAQRAIASDPDSARYHTLYAGVLYRAGRYQDAADELSEAMRLHGGEGTTVQWIWLALVHHRLGNPDEARQWFEKARSWIDQPVVGQSWIVRLQMRLLRREAEDLMKQTPEDKKVATDGEDATDEEAQAEENVNSET